MLLTFLLHHKFHCWLSAWALLEYHIILGRSALLVMNENHWYEKKIPIISLSSNYISIFVSYYQLFLYEITFPNDRDFTNAIWVILISFVSSRHAYPAWKQRIFVFYTDFNNCKWRLAIQVKRMLCGKALPLLRIEGPSQFVSNLQLIAWWLKRWRWVQQIGKKTANLQNAE